MKFWRVTESFVEMRVAMVVNLVVHALESHHLRVDRLGEIMYDHCCAKTKKKINHILEPLNKGHFGDNNFYKINSAVLSLSSLRGSQCMEAIGKV